MNVLKIGPLWVSRTAKGCKLFNGSQERLAAAKVADCDIAWRRGWNVDYRLRTGQVDLSGTLSSLSPTWYSFRGVRGYLNFCQGFKATVSISQPEVDCITIQITGIDGKLDVCHKGAVIGGQPRSVTEIDGKPVINSPSKEAGFSEGVKSVFGFVRLKWGDVLTSDIDVDAPCGIASLFCVALHNSNVVDLLMRDHATG